MLEHLGLVVHAVPRHAQALGQVQLEQPVVAEHLEREALALGGQLDAAVGLVADQAERAQLLDHAGRRRGGHAEALGERVRRHHAALALLQRVDRLRVVLDGLSGAGPALDGAHADNYGIPKPEFEHRHNKDLRPMSFTVQPLPTAEPGRVLSWRHGRDDREACVLLPGAHRARRRARPLRARQARAHRARRRPSCLNGQVSNDIEALTPGTGCYATFLTHKGKMLGDLRVLDDRRRAAARPERAALQALFDRSAASRSATTSSCTSARCSRGCCR